MSTTVHLAVSEIWRNKGRFLLFSLVVALITLLILFIAALGEGLGSGNREYLEKLNGELIAYQDTARLSIASSRLECSTRRALRNVEGVRDVGSVGFSGVTIPMGEDKPLDVSLIGVEPGRPGEPPVVAGSGLVLRNADEAIVDRTVALMTAARVGDRITIRSPQGKEDQFYDLRVVGITDSRKYGLRPAVIVPILTWDRLRPQAVVGGGGTDEPACNVAVVQLEDPEQIESMRLLLQDRVAGIEVVDRRTAYENTPGYSAQQQTLSTQNTFALLIGVLVIGGFFQIQTLQKVPQIGMLKAIGTPNVIVAVSSLIQIVVVTVIGVLIGSLVAFGLSIVFPPTIPIVFELRSGIMAVGSILLMGPLGGLVSIRYSLRVEPLVALGLGS